MSSSDLDLLVDMGFEKERAQFALKKGGNLNGAVDWLEKNADTPLDELMAEDDSNTTNVNALEGELLARSLVCNVCQKKFRTHAAAEFHASKTEHQDFSESVEEVAPLTEEEKKQKLEEAREKAKLRKAAQADADKEEAKRNEKIRQKATQETQDMKEELARKEQIKQAAKKRQEQKDDAEAKRVIKMRIEADKAERKRKAEEEKAAREGRAPPAMTTSAAPAAAPARSAANHNEARLRLQLATGNVMKTLPAETTLFELAQMLESENGSQVTSFTMNFPRKVFEGNLDFGKSLKEAGLTPSAALIVK